MDAHAEWVARDAAGVWHGFTQMAAYAGVGGRGSPQMAPSADTARTVAERAEGHELIDVDGRRYLDAISSLWVTTLGHHVPELDDPTVRELALGPHYTRL